MRGAFVGLDLSHGAASLGYAVAEGVGFGLLDGWQAFGAERDQGQVLSLVGGCVRAVRLGRVPSQTCAGLLCMKFMRFIVHRKFP